MGSGKCHFIPNAFESCSDPEWPLDSTIVKLHFKIGPKYLKKILIHVGQSLRKWWQQTLICYHTVVCLNAPIIESLNRELHSNGVSDLPRVLSTSHSVPSFVNNSEIPSSSWSAIRVSHAQAKSSSSRRVKIQNRFEFPIERIFCAWMTQSCCRSSYS